MRLWVPYRRLLRPGIGRHFRYGCGGWKDSLIPDYMASERIELIIIAVRAPNPTVFLHIWWRAVYFIVDTTCFSMLSRSRKVTLRYFQILQKQTDAKWIYLHGLGKRDIEVMGITHQQDAKYVENIFDRRIKLIGRQSQHIVREFLNSSLENLLYESFEKMKNKFSTSSENYYLYSWCFWDHSSNNIRR
jgi:hypothetical protein